MLRSKPESPNDSTRCIRVLLVWITLTERALHFLSPVLRPKQGAIVVVLANCQVLRVFRSLLRRPARAAAE